MNTLQKLRNKIYQVSNRLLLNQTGLAIMRPLSRPPEDLIVCFDDFIRRDYIRTKTLQLIINEIIANNLEGAIAELGVNKGTFSQLMSMGLPNKTIYLFDTFEGFTKESFKTEHELLIFNKVKDDFSNTSVNIVLDNMPFPDKCIIKKGIFPETTKDIKDEQFCLISLDADLYQSIYDGLIYFYPRLVKGGYIMIHDYNDDIYSGCKQAVKEYCSKFNITIVPIPDGWGSAIITK